MKSSQQKHGLISYDNSYDLGDGIQLIASRKFLPKVDCFFDKNTGFPDPSDSKGEYKDGQIKLIFAGSFESSSPVFPPPISVNPLFLSFSIDDNEVNKESMFSKLRGRKKQLPVIANNVDYLKAHEPIGCRDMNTMNILTKKGIKAYFSGCLSLTLEKTSTKKSNEVLVIDANVTAHDTFNNLTPRSIRRRAVYLSQSTVKKATTVEKNKLTEAFLKRLEEASLVITSKFETAVACLAYDTPVVVMFKDNIIDPQFTGWEKYFTILTPNSKLTFDFETYRNPQSPSLTKLKNTLAQRVANWIGTTEEIKSGCSIFTACMDRSENLEKALPTWLAANPDEIVVVDWNSRESIKPLIDKYNKDNKIKLITVNNVDKWVLTWAFNLAAKFTTKTKILKADCDTLLKPNFFSSHDLSTTKGVFYAGDWRIARDANEVYTNGIIYLRREDFFKAGGYDEGLTTYGWDDCKLYDDCSDFLVRAPLNLDTLSHIEHDNTLRTSNQDLEHPDRLDIEIERNRLLAELGLWKGEFSLYNISKVSNNEYKASHIQAVSIDENIRNNMMIRAVKNREYAMSQLKLEAKGHSSSSSSDDKENKPEVIIQSPSLNDTGLLNKEDNQETKEVKMEEVKANKNKLRRKGAKVNLDNDTSEEEKHVKRLYIDVKNGPGNRMRAFASAYVIAMATGRELHLIWKPDYHCDAKFTDLFQITSVLDGVFIHDAEPETIDVEVIKYDILENQYIVLEKVIYDYMKEKDVYIDDSVDADLFIISACILKNRNTNWDKECAFLRQLTPIQSILDEIQAFESNYDMSNVIGVHVRMGQPVAEAKYESSAEYTEEGKKSLEKWRGNSHWSVFLKEMKRIIRIRPNQQFFLSCDNPEAYTELLNALPNNIICTPRDVYDRSLDQIITAVRDLMIFKDCKYTIGSGWSSYSEMIARLSGKTLRISGKDFF